MTILLDFLFPRKCLGCGQLGAYFCSQCLNYLSLGNQQICPACEGSSIGGRTHPGCLAPQSLDGLTAIFAYKGLVRKAVKKLKYRFVSDLAEDLVELFLSFCGEDKGFVHFCRKNPFLVPIPLHPRRKRWRGFNQAELLGGMIAANLEVDFLSDLLVRIRNTKPQVKLKGDERKKNIKDAFSINPKYSHKLVRPASKGLKKKSGLAGQNSPARLNAFNSAKTFKRDSFVWRLKGNMKNILVFDDVWTSGATLKEAAKVLKRNGVKRVWGLTLAK